MSKYHEPDTSSEKKPNSDSTHRISTSYHSCANPMECKVCLQKMVKELQRRLATVEANRDEWERLERTHQWRRG